MSKDHYTVITSAEGRRKVTKGTQVLFEGDGVKSLVEHHHGQVFPEVLYFPQEGMAMEGFTKNTLQTSCPIKGEASYWNLEGDGEKIENAIWSYLDPLPDAVDIKGLVAFDRKKTHVVISKI